MVGGGSERQDSVYNGLLSCSCETDIVLIHDGARPFLSEKLIDRTIQDAKKFEACAAAVPVKDTIKITDLNRFVASTPERKSLYSVQTPQTFKYDLILNAHKEARSKRISATDDTALVEELGHRVKLTEGDYFNIKITTPEDLIFGEAILNYLQNNK